MKKVFYIVYFFITFPLFAQIDIQGNSYYELKVQGKMARRPDGCGDIDGLHSIKAIKKSGISEVIFSTPYRVIDNDFQSNLMTYTKKDKVVEISAHIVIRYSNMRICALGRCWNVGCNGGPTDNYRELKIIECGQTEIPYSKGNINKDGLANISTISYPKITINNLPSILYLTDTGYLTVTLPDNIDNKYFKWKYSVGGGAPEDIPYSYNYKSTLHIKGSDFLKKQDLGKNVSVWIDLKSVCSYCENPSPINFVYLKTLPTLTNHNYSVTVTKCAGDKVDYKLQFDRALEQGEKMAFNIKKDGSPLECRYCEIDKGNTFTFEDLEAGTYAVSYIGNNTANTYTPYTDGHPFVFTIKNPTQVEL